jgi:hypothetical protein
LRPFSLGITDSRLCAAADDEVERAGAVRWVKGESITAKIATPPRAADIPLLSIIFPLVSDVPREVPQVEGRAGLVEAI